MLKSLFGGVFLIVGVALAGQLKAQESALVITQKFQFQPKEITVKVGDKVRWENHEKRQYHSVWFKASGEPSQPYFFPGESVERVFDKAGVFPYVCEPHEKDGMTGTVIVTK
jgi:plastocyanin